MRLSRNAIGNLINRYKAVLKKCHLMNVFGNLAVAAALVAAPSVGLAAVDPNVNITGINQDSTTYTIESGHERSFVGKEDGQGNRGTLTKRTTTVITNNGKATVTDVDFSKNEVETAEDATDRKTDMGDVVATADATATGNAGAICNSGDEMTFSGDTVTFDGNKVTSTATAIAEATSEYWGEATANATANATVKGGAMYNTKTLSFSGKNVTFLNNGVAATANATATATGPEGANPNPKSVASADGGAVYNAGTIYFETIAQRQT